MAENAVVSGTGGLLGGLNRLSPQAVFVLVAGLFGIALALITPPVQVPDEPEHWFHIYQLSQGRLLAKNYGGDIPLSIEAYEGNQFTALSYNSLAKTSVDTIRDALKVPLEPRNTRFTAFPNTAVYPFVPYVPQTLTMLVARKLKWPALGLMYAGRIGTVLGYLLIGWGAIRITPILKWPSCMILTCPMALFLAGSLSEDPVTTAMVFLATALVLRSVLAPGPLSNATKVALALVMIVVALCKSAYFPVAFLVLAIPHNKWGTGLRKWIVPIGIIVLSMGSFAIWSSLIKANQVQIRGDGAPVQMQWILHHPAEYAGVIRFTLAKYAGMLVDSSIGLLGWLDTPLNQGLIDFWFIALLWVTLAYDEPVKLSWWPRVVAAGVVVLSAGLVLTACYMYANFVGFPEIEGLQGRYFLPVALLMCMVFRRRGAYTVQPKWMLAMLACISLYTVWVVIERYYLPTGFIWNLVSGTKPITLPA